MTWQPGTWQSAYAAKQADGAAERAAMFVPCEQCGADRWMLCFAPTGLPASGPCPGRIRTAAEAEAA